MIYKHQQKSRRLMIYVAHQQYRRQVNFVNISKTAIVRLDENSHGPSWCYLHGVASEQQCTLTPLTNSASGTVFSKLTDTTRVDPVSNGLCVVLTRYLSLETSSLDGCRSDDTVCHSFAGPDSEKRQNARWHNYAYSSGKSREERSPNFLDVFAVLQIPWMLILKSRLLPPPHRATKK